MITILKRTPKPKPLSKKKLIMRRVIPTLKKVQEQKYLAEIKQISERHKSSNAFVKKTVRKVGSENINRFSEKTKRAIKKFAAEKYEQLHLVHGENIPPEELDKIKIETRNLAFGIKRKQEQRKLLTKKEAKTKIITEEILYFNYLKEKHKNEIQNLINYNLALITEKTHITYNDYFELKDEIFSNLKRFPLGYVDMKLVREELLSYRPTRRKFSEMTSLEKKRAIKYLDKQIAKYGSKARQNSNYDKIQKSLGRFIFNL